MSARKIKVRIAFVLDSLGAWNTSGWSLGDGGPDDRETMALCADPLGDIVFRAWITAEIEVPDQAVPSFEGRVEPVDSAREGQA